MTIPEEELMKPLSDERLRVLSRMDGGPVRHATNPEVAIMAAEIRALRGRFLTFEGIDGCGKSTQVRRIIDAGPFDLTDATLIASDDVPRKNLIRRDIYKTASGKYFIVCTTHHWRWCWPFTWVEVRSVPVALDLCWPFTWEEVWSVPMAPSKGEG